MWPDSPSRGYVPTGSWDAACGLRELCPEGQTYLRSPGLSGRGPLLMLTPVVRLPGAINEVPATSPVGFLLPCENE